jgi:hypothetical protein
MPVNNPLERLFVKFEDGPESLGHSRWTLGVDVGRGETQTHRGKRRYMVMDSLLNPEKQEEASA